MVKYGCIKPLFAKPCSGLVHRVVSVIFKFLMNGFFFVYYKRHYTTTPQGIGGVDFYQQANDTVDNF